MNRWPSRNAFLKKLSEARYKGHQPTPNKPDVSFQFHDSTCTPLPGVRVSVESTVPAPPLPLSLI